MKTKEELDKLSNAIGDAERAYYNAVRDNLKESGKEHIVESDDEDDDGLRVRTTDRHDNNVMAVIDKIRFNGNVGCHLYGIIEVHVCEWDYGKEDYWIDIQAFDSDVKPYVYDNIIWDDDESGNTNEYVCPNCGHIFEQGEYNYNCDTALLDFVCPECDWEGNENQLADDEC